MGQALGCIQVEQSKIYVTKNHRILQPGWHCLPWYLGKEVAYVVSLRRASQNFDVRCKTKTKDNVFVTVVASVQFRALTEKAAATYNKLFDAGSQIQAYVIAVIGKTVPKLNLDTVLEQKNDIAKDMEDKLGKAVSASGYEIVQILIVNIEPDVHVKKDGQATHRVLIERK